MEDPVIRSLSLTGNCMQSEAGMFAVRCGAIILRCGAVRCTIFENVCGAVRCGARFLKIAAVRCGAVRGGKNCGAVRCKMSNFPQFLKNIFSLFRLFLPFYSFYLLIFNLKNVLIF